MVNNNETLDGQESVENQKISKSEELKTLYKKRVEEYIENELTKDSKKFFGDINSFIDFNNFKKFLDKNGYLSDFDDNFLNQSFCKDKLKQIVLSESLPRINLFNEVKKRITGEYKILENNTKLDGLLQEQPPSTLKTLIYFQGERQKFLLKHKLLKKDEINTLLSDDKKDDKLLKDIFGKVDESIKEDQEAMESLKKFQNVKQISLYDVKNFLQYLKDSQSKKSFIEYFLPSISLKDAFKYNLISDNQKEELILKEIKYLNLTKEQKKEFLENIDDSNFFIDLSDILVDDKLELLVKSDEILTKLICEYNSSLSVVESVLGEDINFINLQDFITKVKVNLKIDLSGKLSKGNYIKVLTKDNEGKEITNYFHINSIDENNGNFYFENITTRNGISKITNNTSPTSFDTFYKLLKKDNVKIDFFDENSFKKYKEDNKLEEIPNENQINSKEELKKFLKEVDLKGSNVDLQKMAFKCKPLEGSDKTNSAIEDDVFIVSKIDDSFVYIKGQSPMSLTEFATAFKARKCSRFERVDNSEELLKNLQNTENYKELLKDYEIKDKKIIPKSEKGNKDYPGVQYFVGEDGKCIYIEKLNDGSIDFIEGEFKEGDGKKKGNIFEGKKKGKGFDYNTFLLYFSQKKLKPYTKNIIVKKQEENIPSVNRKSSLFKSYMGWASIAEIIAGGKHIVSSIEQSLKTGNKLKAAKLALAMGKFLPESVRQDLQSVVEGEEKKTMEELLKHLTTLDSKIMIPKIEKIITNASSQQYEVEAALAAMYSKYGTLYNKAELSKHRGTFIWYQALGGKVGDALYIETKNKCEEAKAMGGENAKNMPKPFTEEYLIEQLLAKQANGDLKPKRRSKIHKEMGAYLSQGMKAELEDGASKAGNQITVKGRIDYSVAELKNGGFSNGLGAVEKIWSKGGSLAEMHALPFIITMTGISKFFPEELLVKLTSGMGRGTVYTELMFNKDAESLAKFQKGAKAIVKSLLGQKVLEELNSVGKDVGKAYEFWSKYGDKIVDRMIGKDGYIFVMKDKDDDIGNYYKFLHDMQNDDEYSIKRESIDNGLLKHNRNSLTYTMGRKLAKEYITFNQPGRITSSTGTEIFDTYLDHLKEIKDIDYLKDDEKFELFYEIYSTLEPVVRSGFGGWEGGEVMQKSPEVKRLKSYGIDLIEHPYKLPDNQKPTKDTVFGYTENSDSYEKHVKIAYEKFKNINFNDPIEEEEKVVKYSIDDILEKPVANDEEYRQVT